MVQLSSVGLSECLASLRTSWLPSPSPRTRKWLVETVAMERKATSSLVHYMKGARIFKLKPVVSGVISFPDVVEPSSW